MFKQFFWERGLRLINYGDLRRALGEKVFSELAVIKTELQRNSQVLSRKYWNIFRHCLSNQKINIFRLKK